MSPDAVDFIDVAGLLSDEERLVRETVRAYVRDRVLPFVAEWFEEDGFRASWGRSWGVSVCWACISTGTAARVRAPSRTGWRVSSSRPATRACAASPRCKARWPCTPS